MVEAFFACGGPWQTCALLLDQQVSRSAMARMSEKRCMVKLLNKLKARRNAEPQHKGSYRLDAPKEPQPIRGQQTLGGSP
jgi:hypothetical protein